MKIAVTSLGCPRNLVDSEVILGSLKECGARVVRPDERPDILIVNTCAFISSAREESVDAVVEAADLKKRGRIKRLVVCGCLPQLYKGKLLSALPEVDLILGPADVPKIKGLVESLEKGGRPMAVTSGLKFIYDGRTPRSLLTPPHYAYVKIAEGCDNLCSYCIISRLRGRFRSRAVRSVVEEVKRLAAPGDLREIDLIGQDTTSFGLDRGKPELALLLKKLCSLKNSVRWIRILYTHPAHYTDALIDTVRGEEKICKYLDLPIQHVNDKILKGMNRRTTRKEIAALIEKLRRKIPGLVLRTSVIAGFPGETDRDFKELLEFVREARFERLGAFIYSKEPGTRASAMKPQVPGKAKKARFDEVMKLQRAISSGINSHFLGKTLDVLVDEPVKGEKGVFVGRTYADAPEIDGGVYVSGKGLKTGEFYKVKITDALEYDLVGEAI